MYTISAGIDSQQGQLLSQAPPIRTRQDDVRRKESVLQRLRVLGVSRYGLWHRETGYLSRILHPDEYVGGVAYGHSSQNFVLLTATDRRIIFVDIKPLFVEEDEISYDVVSGISYGHVGLASTVTLHTKVKDYKLRTYNPHCAAGFVRYIEERCLERRKGEWR